MAAGKAASKAKQCRWRKVKAPQQPNQAELMHQPLLI
jgi:hypothetical protein